VHRDGFAASNQRLRAVNRRHDRLGWGATPEPAEEWAYDLEFTSMASFADAADRAFGDAGRC
jgi:hypothetical protein